jgi:hypothetical protein
MPSVRPCGVVGCGAVAEIRVGWIPAAAFRDSAESGYATDWLWFRGCRSHARKVWLQARRNGQTPVFLVIEP